MIHYYAHKSALDLPSLNIPWHSCCAFPQRQNVAGPRKESLNPISMWRLMRSIIWTSIKVLSTEYYLGIWQGKMHICLHVFPLLIFRLFEVGSLRQAAGGRFFSPPPNQMSECGAEEAGQERRVLLRVTDFYLIISICIFVSVLILGKLPCLSRPTCCFLQHFCCGHIVCISSVDTEGKL